MKNISRRNFAAWAAAGPLLSAFPNLTRPARAADFQYKFGHGFPLTHPVHTGLAAAAAQTEKDTGGALKIEVFGASQLGGDSQMISQLRSGGVEFFTTAGLILSTFVPVAAIYGMGFAFKDYDSVWKAIDGDLGGHIRAAFAKAGVHPFETVWDNGFRQISTSTRPLNKADDLKGLKIRVPVSPLYTSMFKALGAAPVNLNLGEAYAAMQTQLVDGQENPLVMFESAKFFEVQKSVAETNHIWDGAWLLAANGAWAALPADMQAIVTRNFNAEGLRQRAASASLNQSLKQKLSAAGINFTQPDIASFKSALRSAGFYGEWQKKFDPAAWALLTKYSCDLS
jgi:TRAP-type transport system periplasmic protein